MGCTVFKPKRATRADVVRDLGENPFTRSDHAFMSEVVTTGEEGLIFMCGSAPPAPLCPCGHLSDLLCDWPMGRGKTCDLPLCSECSVRIGEDRDLCLIHHNLFAKDNPVPRIFEVGPRIVRP